jgi:hypothetical protein
MGSLARSFRRQKEMAMLSHWCKGSGRYVPPLAAAVKQACTAYFGELGDTVKEAKNRERFDAETKTEMKRNGAR